MMTKDLGAEVLEVFGSKPLLLIYYRPGVGLTITRHRGPGPYAVSPYRGFGIFQVSVDVLITSRIYRNTLRIWPGTIQVSRSR